MHNGSATAVSRAQAMCRLGVVLFSNRVVYGLGTFSAIFGLEIAILGFLICVKPKERRRHTLGMQLRIMTDKGRLLTDITNHAQ